MDIKTLSDCSKYVTDANVFYAIRERFLNNNKILDYNSELDTSYFDELMNSNDYLYLFDNIEIRNHLACYMMRVGELNPDWNMEQIIDNYKIYAENGKNISFGVKHTLENDCEYEFFVSSHLADYEMIDFDLLSNNIKFSKYMHSMKLGDSKYDVIEQYGYGSIEKDGLNKITIDLYLNYNLNKEEIVKGNYSCSDCRKVLTLNNGEESLETYLNEEQFNMLAAIITDSAKEDKTLAQCLEENYELMIEICGQEYSLFLEKTQAITFTLQKPVK